MFSLSQHSEEIVARIRQSALLRTVASVDGASAASGNVVFPSALVYLESGDCSQTGGMAQLEAAWGVLVRSPRDVQLAVDDCCKLLNCLNFSSTSSELRLASVKLSGSDDGVFEYQIIFSCRHVAAAGVET